MDAHIPPIQAFSTVRTPYAGGVKPPPPKPVPENALAMGLVQHSDALNMCPFKFNQKGVQLFLDVQPSLEPRY